MTSGDVAQAERALERLFRLSVSRSMHARQSAAVGARVTRAGYALLRSLHEQGALTMAELARECAMDPAAAARQVQALEHDRLVRREVGEHDARTNVVHLTDDGRAVYRRMVNVRTRYLEQVLASWPRADRAALADLVDRLVTDLQSVPYRPRPEKTS